MRTVGVVTVGRSDYGCYLPILRRIKVDAQLSLRLLVAGAHLAPEFGLTVRAIEADGFEVHERIEMLVSSDGPQGVGLSMGLGTMGFARAFARSHPDLVMVLGDRFEMHAAAVAAVPFRIPVVHLHGGELTQGAFDDGLRHSMTKLSHLHYTATQDAAQRVIQLGEEPWRVTVSGAPSLDHLRSVRLLTKEEVERRLELDVAVPPLLVTYHPETLAREQPEAHVEQLIAALDHVRQPIVWTMPNPDPHSRAILALIHRFIADHPQARFVDNLQTQAYFSVMAIAAAMVGNSSSGIIEAPSFQLPVVNIGQRQAGRLRAANVIDVDPTREAIQAGLSRALSREFRTSLVELVNPYGDGRAAERIVQGLKDVALDQRLLLKRFQVVQPSTRPVPASVSAR